jgi:hypothetical protein
MNVTLKIPDELGKAAKHRAVDESTSLSKWVASLVERELSQATSPRKSLIDIIAQTDIPPEHQGKQLPLEDRRAGKVREFSFYDEAE